MNNTPNYYTEFEGLRALMAWWVVLGHIANSVGIYYSRDLGAGWKFLTLTNIPVDIFIALSGFAIFSLLSKKSIAYKNYLIGRFFRIFPVYFFCLAIGIAVYDWRLAQHLANPSLSAESISALNLLSDSVTNAYWSHLAAHFTMLHGIFPDQYLYGSGHSFIGPAWSLSLEWQFYLAAPILFSLFKKNLYFISGIGLFFVLTDLILRNSGLTFSYGAFLPIKIGFFFAGISTFFYSRKMYSECFAALAVTILQSLLSDNWKTSIISTIIWMLITLLVVDHQKNSRLLKKVNTVLNTSLFRWLGSISFATYLVHVFVIDFFAYIFSIEIISKHTAFYSFSLLLAPVIITTTLTSLLIHKFIEFPFMQLGRKFHR